MAIEIEEETKPSLNEDSNRDRTYSRTFLVNLTAPHLDAGPKEVVLALGIGIGDTYAFGEETDESAYVNSRSCNQGEYKYQYRINVEYGPFKPAEENPLNEVPQVTWGTVQYEERLDITVEPDPDDRQWVLNTAGQPFDPPVMRDIANGMLTITRNELTYDEAYASSLRNTVNGTEYITADISVPIGTAKIANITASRQKSQYLVDNLISPFGIYWTVTYEIHFDIRGWQALVLCNGRMQRSLDGTKLETIMISGVPVTEAVPLDINGRRVEPGYEDDPDVGIVVQEFMRYPPSEFEVALNF